MTPATSRLPIVFVHGDSNNAGHWIAQLWRFESNHYPSSLLFPLSIPHPSARANDSLPEANRSSTEEAALAVSSMVDHALAATGANKVVLVANSRGCHTCRNYVKNFGGQAKVAAMVLTGAVHGGVIVKPDEAQDSEYNGAGKFLTALNAGTIIPEGVAVTNIRSDFFDLYCQPDGRYIGSPGTPTGANYDSSDLPGATNIVLPGVDHRETAFSPAAFVEIYRAITGSTPATVDIVPVEQPILSGTITGYENLAPSNLPVGDARVTIYRTDPESGARIGEAVHRTATGSDGRWGPFAADSTASYEFVVEAPGIARTRFFRSPFARSSAHIDMVLYPAPDGDQAGTFVMRPRGYMGPDDSALANGAPIAGIDRDDPVPSVWQLKLDHDAGGTVRVEFNGEMIAARAAPREEGPTFTWIELTY